MSEVLADRLPILDLLARLYRALDDGDADRLAACFASDATWHRADGPKIGTAEIRSVATGRPANRTTSHVPSNVVVEQDGTEIVVTYYLTVYEEIANAGASLLAILDCEDRIERGPDGLRISDKRTASRMRFTR